MIKLENPLFAHYIAHSLLQWLSSMLTNIKFALRYGPERKYIVKTQIYKLSKIEWFEIEIFFAIYEFRDQDVPKSKMFKFRVTKSQLRNFPKLNKYKNYEIFTLHFFVLHKKENLFNQQKFIF